MLSTGDVLGEKYRIEESLGTGGMGEVFHAQHLFLEKPVAIKALHPHFAEDEEAVKRFYREAQAAAALRHRGIVDVYDVGWQPDGTPYIVMEYLTGENLRTRIRREGGKLDAERAAAIAVEVLSVLVAVHDKGIVHRDLKPENVFLCRHPGECDDDATIKLVDFGVSKVLTPDLSSSLTKVGELVGSVPYMAPEQARGSKGVDHRVDIWGVGAMLYRALTGQVPFPEKRPYMALLAIMEEPLEPPRSVEPSVPETLDAIVCRALAKERKERHSDARHLRSELLGYLEEARQERRSALAGKKGREETKVDLRTVSPSAVPSPPSEPPPPRRPSAPAGDGVERVPCLRVVKGLDAGRVVAVTEKGVHIGRGPDNELVLLDESVSRRHARVSIRGGEVVIEDLGSTNGLCVNGTRSVRAVLQAGDSLMIGNLSLLKFVRLRTDDVQHHVQLYESVALDVLTGALNRRSIDTRLASEWSYACRHDLDMSVLLLDVDGFSLINDRFGNDGGDGVLRDLSRIIRSEIRGEDVFGRCGGEEFLVASLGVGHKGAVKLAKRLRKSIARHPFVVSKARARLTVSLGVATFHGSSSHWPEELVGLASSRLAKAKSAGGNREVTS